MVYCFAACTNICASVQVNQEACATFVGDFMCFVTSPDGNVARAQYVRTAKPPCVAYEGKQRAALW